MTTMITRTARLIVSVACCGLLCRAGNPAAAQPSLDAGPYGVGFQTIERYDYSRAFRPKKDYFGERQVGERAANSDLSVVSRCGVSGRTTHGVRRIRYVLPRRQ